MRRSSLGVLALVCAAALAGCSSPTAPPAPLVPPGEDGGVSEPLSGEASAVLAEIDCQDPTAMVIAEDSPVLQAGICVPYAGIDAIEFYELPNEAQARTWAASDELDIGGVDGVYLAGPVILVDRNNVYLLQLSVQYEPLN